MGANAQTTVPTFTAGEVLTAAQQNASARTGVPVFASTTTRDAGFGGTGEKTLAEGQLCYVEGTGLQSYNGTSWVTWGTAPSSGALTLISATTIGSAVASVTVSNAFSTTYDNYLINVSGGAGSTNLILLMTLGSTATGYYNAGYSTDYPTNNVSGTGGAGSPPDTAWYAGRAGANGLTMNMFLSSPFLSARTWWASNQPRLVTTAEMRHVGGFLDNATSYTAFTLTTSTGTLTGGTIRVYGYANS